MKVLLCIMSLFLMFSCSNNPNFSIDGDIKGIEKGNVLLYGTDGIIDSTTVVAGEFLLEGSLDMPSQLFLHVRNELGKRLYTTRLFMDNRDVRVEIDISSEQKTTKVLDSPLQDEYNEYSDYISSLPETQAAGKLSPQIMTAFRANDNVLVDKLEAEEVAYYKIIVKKIMAFKSESRSSHITPYYLNNYLIRMDLEDKIAAVAYYPADFTESFYLNWIRDNIEKEKKVAIGEKATNFQAKDLQGQEYTLESFKGKYLYLEFSASWCGWCKKEIPFIREAYHKLKNENIVFVTINMDDAREKWEREVKHENIEWLCLSNLEGMKSELAKSYNIQGLPASYVIDPDGNIIQKDIRQKEVVEYLSSLFK